MHNNLNWFVLSLSWTQESELLWIKEKNLLSTYFDYQIASKTDRNVTQKLVGLVRVDQFWSFCVVFCNPLNVFPSFYDIVCLFFCNLRLLISPLVSSNFCYINHINNSVSFPLITEYLPNLEWRYWTSISLVYYPYIHYLITSKSQESEELQVTHSFTKKNRFRKVDLSIVRYYQKKILFANYIIKNRIDERQKSSIDDWTIWHPATPHFHVCSMR